MQTIGRYRIDAPIGEGAMAHVYLAHDPSIDRPVAIKILKPEYRTQQDIVERFISESQAAGKLSHPHIVTIFDVGQVDGAPYIAMERLSGRPLDELLTEQGRFPFDHAIRLAIQIAEALSFAHSHGIVHRDVKPSNILVCDGDKTAKLLDFGIARIDGRDGAARLARTQAGQVLGTPRYMSPEQALGLPVDERSDLFSLGVMLYEMLTGRVAFNGTGLATLAVQIAQEDPIPIEREIPDCPKGVRFIVAKLLAKKPDQRFSDAQQLALALRRELDSAQAVMDAPRRGLALRYKLPLLLAGAAMVALGLGTGFVIDRQNAAMQDMAITSGSSMTAFVARNAALRLADNAGLPAAQQDWAPLQAFAETAATDPNVQKLVIVDGAGTVRAANDLSLLGKHFKAIRDEAATTGDADPIHISQSATQIRFVQTIHYAGADFGKVDIVMSRAPLNAAEYSTALLLSGLAIFVTMVIAAFGALSASMLGRPLRRLRVAMDDVTSGNVSFRLSHRRNDEIGALFDAMNRMVASIADRQDHVATTLANAEKAMAMTWIEPRRDIDKRVA